MDNKNYHFFAYMSRMKYINRWGLMKNIQVENIQEHSHMVGIIAHALAAIKNKFFNGNLNPERISVYALYHESSEIFTTDIISPIKYFNPEIARAFKSVEEIAKEKLVKMLPTELEDFYREILLFEDIDSEARTIVKAADRISAYVKCLEEEKNGNNEFKKAKEATYKTIVDMNLPEVNYFLEYFIPSFSLTLDEMD